jgi:hypothetical protein
MDYTQRKLEQYSNDYLLKFFDVIEDNTVVDYSHCGEYFDYLQPLINDLFPSLIIEYIDPDHYLHEKHDNAFTFLVRTPNGKVSDSKSVVHCDPVLFDAKELVMD